MGEHVLPEKGILKTTTTIKKFEYLRSGSESKNEADIAKDQNKFFKDQINVNNNIPTKKSFHHSGGFQWNSTGVMENDWKMTGTNGTSGIPLKFRWNSSSS